MVWHLILSDCPEGGIQVSAPTVRTLPFEVPDTNPLDLVMVDCTKNNTIYVSLLIIIVELMNAH